MLILTTAPFERVTVEMHNVVKVEIEHPARELMYELISDKHQ